MSADRGLPLIVALAVVNGALAAWQIADLAAAAQLRHVHAVAERNLDQAEKKFVACIENEPFTIGTAIYIPATRKSTLTTAQVPEVGGLEDALRRRHNKGLCNHETMPILR